MRQYLWDPTAKEGWNEITHVNILCKLWRTKRARGRGPILNSPTKYPSSSSLLSDSSPSSWYNSTISPPCWLPWPTQLTKMSLSYEPAQEPLCISLGPKYCCFIWLWAQNYWPRYIVKLESFSLQWKSLTPSCGEVHLSEQWWDLRVGKEVFCIFGSEFRG